jgi:hypothetical protein
MKPDKSLSRQQTQASPIGSTTINSGQHDDQGQFEQRFILFEMEIQ